MAVYTDAGDVVGGAGVHVYVTLLFAPLFERFIGVSRSIFTMFDADGKGECTEHEEASTDHCDCTRTHRAHHSTTDENSEQDDECNRSRGYIEFHGGGSRF